MSADDATRLDVKVLDTLHAVHVVDEAVLEGRWNPAPELIAALAQLTARGARLARWAGKPATVCQKAPPAHPLT